MKKVSIAIFAVLIAIASCSKKTAPTAEVKIDGASVFSSNCARCHGAEGIKDSRTPNLQTIALDKAGLINSITHGKNKMPAFEDKLSVAEISAVADLIVSWHNK
ncbi:MAG: cytochrome c [Bacteroidota bacterium]